MKRLEYGKVDSREKALDYAIRDFENKNDPIECGYEISDKSGDRQYWNYMSKSAWSNFMSSMSLLHKAQYNDGDGRELSEKKNRYGLTPPKMASFGSSSRFIYKYSKDIDGFSFEKPLPTRVGHTANIDGYASKNNVDIYVEAKCREIYGSHKKLEVANVYKKVYDYLHSQIHDFSYKDLGSTDNEHFNCAFYWNDSQIIHFDIKQLICHFLGITANILEHEYAKENVKFIYLIFDPRNNTDFNALNKFSSYEYGIYKTYDETINEISRFDDMKSIFDMIMRFQSQNLGLQVRPYNFDFNISNQNNYQNIVKD